MALITSFDRFDTNSPAPQDRNSSFFDYNSEMKNSSLFPPNKSNDSPAFGKTDLEPASIDFGDLSNLYTGTGSGARSTPSSERVIQTGPCEASDTFEYNNPSKFTYDRNSSNEIEQSEQFEQNQTRQLLEMAQKLMQTLVALSMLYGQWLQQNSAGSMSGNNNGNDSGSAAPDADYGNSDNYPSRPANNSKPKPPSIDKAGGTSKPHNQNNQNNPDKSPNKDDSDDRGNTDSPERPGSEKSENAANSDNSASPSGTKYADTGVERGRTIFRDDFSGARGEMPNQKIFDTAHIGADNKDRQRGPSIDEDGIARRENTVMDGNGNLQMFAKQEKTWDPVAKEYVNYTKGTYHTTDGLNFNLKDHPEGVVVEVRAKHPTADGAKFNALWIMTERWSADPAKGESKGDTIEYDAAEGGGADIAIHYPVRDAETGKSKDNYGGGAHPDIDFNDGKFHTYTVAITPNSKTGRGDVVQYVDGKKVLEKENVFPGDKPLHIKASMEVSPKWTHKTLTGPGGMDSNASGVIDYVDISELKKK